MSDTPKKTFGKYEAISHLGSGAMGVVWRAQDPVLGRTVAIKTISASLGSDNENKERFLREARAAAQLNHPNIITVFDFGQADNELYMAMELLEGKDLKELITQGQLTFDQKLDIMEQVADGLAYAHGRDVIHRDLKPGNIHVQPNGQVKILDFGLARLGSSDLTKTGVVMGTPNYMSPEQVMGERVDARSDVFSAGAVFYELLTNRKPFDAESVHATLYQVVHRDAPPPRQWDPRLPDAIVTIIEIAMNKNVEGRYKNAGALRDAIRAFRYGEEPEVVEFEEGAQDQPPPPPAADATAISQSPPAASNTGTQKAAPFRSYGRTTGSGSVPPTAGVSSAPYTTGRIARPGSRPPVRPGGPNDPRSASASIPPEAPKSTNPLLIVGVLGLLVIVGFVGYGVLTRKTGDEAAQSRVDALTASLVETQLDLARRVLEDKDYKGAITRANGILKLDPQNPEALAIREQAQGATREIETSVATAREAVTRGDSAQASTALERVMALDPKNPVVAELSSQLNANFSRRATEAKTEMEKAKTLAAAKEGASADPAFAEAEKFAATAAQNLTDRQFTAATQTFLQARDAYDRARRVIENKERDAAKAAKAAATPSTVATPTTVALATPAPSVGALPTINLRPLPTATLAPATPAPTAAPVQTQTPPPAPTGPVPEPREFTTGRTRIAAAPGAKKATGFEVELTDFAGSFEFEVTPSPLVPGAPFRVRVFLKNTGKNDARLDSFTAKIARNGEISSPPTRILEDDVKAGQRPLVVEIPLTWAAGTRTWVMDIEAMSKKGERFRSNLTMKQP